MARNKAVTVGQLPDQMGQLFPRVLLVCLKCGAEYSAHAGDYWAADPDHVFKCCRRNMVLAERLSGYVLV